MPSLSYQVDQSIFLSYPGYRRGLLVVRGAANNRRASRLEEMLRAEESLLRSRLQGLNVTDHPTIAAWRDAYRKFGAKPSEHRSSIEAMTRRVVKSDKLPVINPLVDIGNVVSLRYLVPIGVHPLPSDGASLELRRAMDGDVFLPPDGSAAEAPMPAEVVFCEGHSVLTRRWTWRQASGTRTLPETSDVIFNIDGLLSTTEDDMRAAMCDLEQLLSEFTGGGVILNTVLTADQPKSEIFLNR